MTEADIIEAIKRRVWTEGKHRTADRLAYEDRGPGADEVLTKIALDALAAIRAAGVALVPREATARHISSGTSYDVLGEAEVQISRIDPVEYLPSGGDRRISDGDTLTIYCGSDGKLWARFPDEFTDGRFEVSTSPLAGKEGW